MNIHEIRKQLQDRRLSVVQEKTGLHYNTLKSIRDSDNANPTLRTIQALSDYFQDKGAK